LLLTGMESQPAGGPRIAPTELSPQAASSGFTPPPAEELAAQFPQLEIVELLGRGGMGAVYKARQPGLDRLVALKILPRQVGDTTFAERFAREARALARLNHPNIVAVYDFGRTGDGLFYLVMEYVDGVNLRQAIRSGGMSPQQALAIVPQICDALQFAHDEGIVHRDIKPENILIDKRGRVKIADFGLAKLLGQEAADQQLTGTQQVMGTLRYMAPEQMEGSKSVDHRADIYSLGVVFYELLTGELPIGRFAPPSKKVQIDVRLDEVVLRALEKEPEQRYQHASEVKTDVQSILSGVAPEACAVRPGPPAAAVGAPEPSGLADGAEIEPRLSRSAVWGAIWGSWGILAGVALAAGAFLIQTRTYETFAARKDLNYGVTFLLLLPLALLAAAAPFGTTILGGVAIAQIKRSRGRIYGLPLAEADLLLYPMLLLLLAVLVFPVLMATLVVCFFVAWAAWRSIRPVAPKAGSNSPAILIASELQAKPGYVKWVVVPMLVLFALWLAVSIVTTIPVGPLGRFQNYRPRTAMQVEGVGLFLLVLALTVLLLLRWMQTLPKAVRTTLVKRLALSAVSFVLAVGALSVYLNSPWNCAHVEVHALTFLPKSKAYSRLEIDLQFISHQRTEGPYGPDDKIELWLKTYARKDVLQGRMWIDVIDRQLTWYKPTVVAGDQPNQPKTIDVPERLTRETFLDCLKDNSALYGLDLSKPEGREAAEELWKLLELTVQMNPRSWEEFVGLAKQQLGHYDFGEDLGTTTGVLGYLAPKSWFALLLTVVLGFLSAVFASIWSARVQGRRLANRPATPKPAAAILPQPSTKPGYVKWVVVPMLVLFAVWLAVSIATIVRYGQPGNYEPLIVMQVHAWGLALLVLAVPVLLLIRWMQTLPKAVRSTLAKRLVLSAASSVLGLVAFMVFVVSPWNQPHVEEHGMTFQPKSKQYSRLKISARFISHYRTEAPYYVDDTIELTLRMYGRKDFLQGFMRAELANQQLTWVVPSLVRGDQATPNTNDAPRREPLTREAFLRWCRDIPNFDLSKPEVREEAEQLLRLIESWAGENLYEWKRFVSSAKEQLHDYDFGEDLATRSYVRGNLSRNKFLIAFLLTVLGFVFAVFASIWSAIVQRKRLADRRATP